MKKKFLRKVTAVGFKRAENSRGNFVKCITGCDVREKNHLSRIIIDGLIFRSLVKSAFGRGDILFGPKVSLKLR